MKFKRFQTYEVPIIIKFRCPICLGLEEVSLRQVVILPTTMILPCSFCGDIRVSLDKEKE